MARSRSWSERARSRPKDVTYANLALVVIDEEQRFGAADKARLARSRWRQWASAEPDGDAHSADAAECAARAEADVDHRDAAGAPPTDPDACRRVRRTPGADGAAAREGRGGQSFVVVPRIEDLARLAGNACSALFRTCRSFRRTAICRQRRLTSAMVRFASGKGDVLLATNIIEAGLDVPRANTMIVWRADRFGLAQLHQLRGRVGRGNRRGQYPADDGAGRALDRGNAEAACGRLESLDRLGAGFAISARDLDIRGAGDLVGDAQSGHMKLIGVDLYQHLLERALRETQGETLERWTPVINVGVSGRIPPDWIPEADTRLSLYLRLARLTSRSKNSMHSRTSSWIVSARSRMRRPSCCALLGRGHWRGMQTLRKWMRGRTRSPLLRAAILPSGPLVRRNSFPGMAASCWRRRSTRQSIG